MAGSRRRSLGGCRAWHSTPPTQYADDANLRARQRLWDYQDPPFDIVDWVLQVAGVAAGQVVLDVGCGNGAYLRELRRRGVGAVGCDLSLGMLRAAAHPASVNADVTRLPVRDQAFDVVLAPHMLYHAPDREAAARELRRITRRGGVCVVTTNGQGHNRALRELVQAAVRKVTPGWEMSDAPMRAFSLENGGAVLGRAFASVSIVRPTGVGAVRLRDAAPAADYVASVADHYQDEVAQPWPDVVNDVRAAVQRQIDARGEFTTSSDLGAFVCR